MIYDFLTQYCYKKTHTHTHTPISGEEKLIKKKNELQKKT